VGPALIERRAEMDSIKDPAIEAYRGALSLLGGFDCRPEGVQQVIRIECEAAQALKDTRAESVRATDTVGGDPPKWDRVVVLEISVEGNGLYWLDGQGDWSAPGDDVYWFALDANADPEHNLKVLRQVKKHRLEPRFAAMIDETIRDYQDLSDENSGDETELEP
jgi:hypothetical protein